MGTIGLALLIGWVCMVFGGAGYNMAKDGLFDAKKSECHDKQDCEN